MIDTQDISKVVEILQAGGVILYPTDTIWGIGCDATNPTAVSAIYKLKQREDTKSMIILVDKPGRIPSYVSEMPDIAWDLIEQTITPLTIIYSGAKNLANNLIASDGTIGIRVVKHEFCQRVIERLRKPIVSTSANISGNPYPRSFGEIPGIIKEGVNFIVPEIYENSHSAKPSGVIMLGPKGEVKVLRE